MKCFIIQVSQVKNIAFSSCISQEMSIFMYHLKRTQILKAMLKDNRIISEISSFFDKNDSNKAINSIMRVLSFIPFRSSSIGFVKRPNCKLDSVQVLMLLILFPFFRVRNIFQYTNSALSTVFSCQKDMFYRLMEQDDIDWRKILYSVNLHLYRQIRVRSDSKASTECLIIDDTDLPKTGFKSEMIGRIYSHVLHKSILGYKGLFMCHTDGKTQTMLDFSLHGEEGKNADKPQELKAKQLRKRFTKDRKEDSCVNTRLSEYKESKITRSIEMVKTAIKKGVRFDYLLVDSWFTCGALIEFISSRHIKCHLVGMIKMGNTKYETKLGNLKASDIIAKLSKAKAVKYSRKLNCYYAQIEAVYADRKVKLFFCRRGKKGNWNAFLTTHTELDFFKAYQIYAMRWAVEVCFSEMKGLLKLGKCQARNFSSQIASISITMIQYNILSSIKRFEAYETIGGLFRTTINGAIELSVTDRIWELIIQVVAIIAEMFSADEEEIIKKIVANNEKCKRILDYHNLKKVG